MSVEREIIPAMRASRLISILLLLQTRGRTTAQQLADALEVSVRTIYRDVASLAAAGVPLYGETGWEGGYQLVDGYNTRLTGLTEAEAESLFLVGLPQPAADLGLGSTVAAARLKLMAALLPEQRDRVDRQQERFHMDVPGWYVDADRHASLPVIADAVWTQRRVRVRYRRWKPPREVTRTLDPYGLVLKAGNWYVVAQSAANMQTYRISNVLDAEALDEHFERTAGFDLARHWRSYLDDFHARRHHGHAVVRLSPSAFDRLADVLEPAAVRAALQSARSAAADGWIEVTFPTESTEQAVPELLKFGADVEVLAPPMLRDSVMRTVAALSALYGPPTATFGTSASPNRHALVT
jgi:predicted DNA-binding transcriptional regulator YafY